MLNMSSHITKHETLFPLWMSSVFGTIWGKQSEQVSDEWPVQKE